MCSEGGGEEERYRTNFSQLKFSGGGKRRGEFVERGEGEG